MASFDLWIWNAFFRVTSSNNDINMTIRLVFDEVLDSPALKVNYNVNGNNYTMGVLCNGWYIF